MIPKTKYIGRIYNFFSGIRSATPKYIAVKKPGIIHIPPKIPSNPYEVSILLPDKRIAHPSGARRIPYHTILWHRVRVPALQLLRLDTAAHEDEEAGTQPPLGEE